MEEIAAVVSLSAASSRLSSDSSVLQPRRFTRRTRRLPSKVGITFHVSCMCLLTQSSLHTEMLYTICGGYRRGKAMSSDVDIVLTRKVAPGESGASLIGKHQTKALKEVIEELKKKSECLTRGSWCGVQNRGRLFRIAHRTAFMSHCVNLSQPQAQ